MQAGGEVVFLYALANHLRKSVAEVLGLSEEELAGWAVFFKERSSLI
jgi:hypothetical protein